MTSVYGRRTQVISMKQYKIFLISVLSLLPASFKAQVTDAELLRLLAENDSYVRQLRRHFHEYPEVGGRETATVSRLKAELKKLGTFDIHDVPGSTGFYAILDTHRPGPTIGLRTDIDGLPIAESTVNGGGRQKPFLSRNANVMQGCGHDGHMAILLGAAKILSSLSDLTGRVVFWHSMPSERSTDYSRVLSPTTRPTTGMPLRRSPSTAGWPPLSLRWWAPATTRSEPPLATIRQPSTLTRKPCTTVLGQWWHL